MKHRVEVDRDRIVKEKILQIRVPLSIYMLLNRACSIQSKNKSEFCRDVIKEAIAEVLDLRSKNSSSED